MTSMDRNQLLSFELYVMDLCESQSCKTAEDYENLSDKLHEAIETAIQEMCIDNDIDDYEPSY